MWAAGGGAGAAAGACHSARRGKSRRVASVFKPPVVKSPEGRRGELLLPRPDCNGSEVGGEGGGVTGKARGGYAAEAGDEAGDEWGNTARSA
jgi:hypothetical protein